MLYPIIIMVIVNSLAYMVARQHHKKYFQLTMIRITGEMVKMLTSNDPNRYDQFDKNMEDALLSSKRTASLDSSLVRGFILMSATMAINMVYISNVSAEAANIIAVMGCFISGSNLGCMIFRYLMTKYQIWKLTKSIRNFATEHEVHDLDALLDDEGLTIDDLHAIPEIPHE